jgi:hypothetical protein
MGVPLSIIGAALFGYALGNYRPGNFITKSANTGPVVKQTPPVVIISPKNDLAVTLDLNDPGKMYKCTLCMNYAAVLDVLALHMHKAHNWPVHASLRRVSSSSSSESVSEEPLMELPVLGSLTNEETTSANHYCNNDLPAAISPRIGNDELCRDNDLPAVIYQNKLSAYQQAWMSGKTHRVDGPIYPLSAQHEEGTLAEQPQVQLQPTNDYWKNVPDEFTETAAEGW